MKLLTALTCIVISVFMFGCSGAQKALSPENVPNCMTIIEGNFHSRVTWNGDVPVLLLKNSENQDGMKGRIIEKTAEGIRFDQNRVSPFYDPAEKFYPYEDIICAIDENREIIYGSIPNKFSIVWNADVELVPQDTLKAKPTILELKANRRFSFCLNTGLYLVKKITFKGNNGYVDEAIHLPEMELMVERGYNNYVGDLYLNFSPLTSEETCLLPFKIKYRPDQAAMGAMFGLVGALIYSATTASLHEASLKGAAGVHTLDVKEIKDFSNDSRLPPRISLLKYKNRFRIKKTNAKNEIE